MCNSCMVLISQKNIKWNMEAGVKYSKTSKIVYDIFFFFYLSKEGELTKTDISRFSGRRKATGTGCI